MLSPHPRRHTCRADTIFRVSWTSFSKVSFRESSSAICTTALDDSTTSTHINELHKPSECVLMLTVGSTGRTAALLLLLQAVMRLSVRVAALLTSWWRQWSDGAEAHERQKTLINLSIGKCFIGQMNRQYPSLSPVVQFADFVTYFCLIWQAVTGLASAP